MGRWQLLAGPPLEAPDVELTTASARSAVFRVAEPSTLEFQLPGRHQQTGSVHELATDVHLVRDNVPLYTGRVGPSSDEVTEVDHGVAVATADTRALLDRRLWPVEPHTLWAGDTGALARHLVDTAQARTGGNLGIDTTSVADTGTHLVREVAGGASVRGELDAAGAHGRPGAGFDWDISPGWTDRRLRLWAPERGQDRGVVLDYTRDAGRARSSVVANATRELDPADYANTVRVVGGVRVEKRTTTLTTTDPDTGEPVTETVEYEVRIPTVPATRSLPATGPEGLWESHVSDTSLVWQSEVDARADAELARLAMLQPAYTVKLRDGAWDGPEHIWLGDTVRLILRSGRLNVDTTLRVQELALELGDSGAERVTLTVGSVAPTLLRHLHAMERRLGRLER